MENNYREGYDKSQLKERVLELLKVSSIPVTLQKVLKVFDDENSTNGDMVKAIEFDQALSSRLVSMANSSFYGYGKRITNIPDATILLGFNMVRNLTISTSLFNLGDNLGDERERVEALWKHAYRVAIASALIAERTGVVKREEAFLAGLINDLGRIILYQLFGEVYLNISSYGREGLFIREEEAFGATHAEAGKWFAEKYKFPREIVLSMEYHHNPEAFLSQYNNGSLQIIPIVYLADCVVSEGLDDGFEIDIVPSARHEEIMKSVYIDLEGLKAVKESLAEKEAEMEDFYSI